MYSSVLFGLSLGVADYLLSSFPIVHFRTIPLLVFISLIAVSYTCLKKGFKFALSETCLLFLLSLGLSMAISRYFLIYGSSYSFLPIIRQGTSFAFGIVVLMYLRILIQKESLEKISNWVLITSILFLSVGTYQFSQNHFHGYFPRVKALFSEPSYFGDYLVLVLAPLLVVKFSEWKNLSSGPKTALICGAFFWLFNFYIVQSGTAILKMASFVFVLFIFWPMKRLYKFSALFLGAFALVTMVYLNDGYVKAIYHMAVEVYYDPNIFFKYHTFYDRFYPIYITFKNFITWDGFLGHGFGGDYFEFKNLFPPSTHAEMLAYKPNFSFFNSFASKIIYYFGVFGLVLMIEMTRRAFTVKNFIVKAGLLNVIISSLWGVSNFSLPYLWFWVAISGVEFFKTTEVTEKNFEGIPAIKI